MLGTAYRLVAPRTFEPTEISVPLGQSVVVRPLRLSICNADMRYYLGRRSAKAMREKLPMALIHEGVGQVVYDGTGTYQQGTVVVMVPNRPASDDGITAENYRLESRFCGSGFDGFMQEYVSCSPDRLVAALPGMDLSVAAFTELVSVAMHAVNRFEALSHGRREHIGVWGDGNLGFIVSLLLRMRMPQARISVVGRNAYKLADFTFVDDAVLSADAGTLVVDHAFECCGGDGSTSAVDQIIDVISPEGSLALLGVSENPVPVNTRMVLEKGLRLFGSSRSGRQDFVDVMELYRARPETLQYLEALVGDVITVRTVADMNAAFEADARKSMGKTIMVWDV